MPPSPAVPGGRFPSPSPSPQEATGKRRCFMFRNLLPGQRAPSLCSSFASQSVFSPSSVYTLTRRAWRKAWEQDHDAVTFPVAPAQGRGRSCLPWGTPGKRAPDSTQGTGRLKSTQRLPAGHCRALGKSMSDETLPEQSGFQDASPRGRPLTELVTSRTGFGKVMGAQAQRVC